MTPCIISPLKTRCRAGYARKKVKGRRRFHHRLVYAAAHGLDEATMGGVVMHSCDNRPCINPDHLSLGTHQDNSDDMVAKGRSGNRVLSDADVEYIRANFKPKVVTAVALASKFGVQRNQIYRVLRGEQR